MAGNFGYNAGNGSSPRRRVHVLRGFDAVNAQSITRNAPVAEGVVIYSGMAMSLNAQGEWVLGQPVAGSTVFIALSNYNDTDVNASGFLPGLSCQDNYVIETAWFDSSTDADYQDELTRLVANLDGTVGPAGSAADADTIIGKVQREPYKLNSIEEVAISGGTEGVATHPFLSNENGTSEVISFVTTQD
jgi:hypothetical protein